MTSRLAPVPNNLPNVPRDLAMPTVDDLLDAPSVPTSPSVDVPTTIDGWYTPRAVAEDVLAPPEAASGRTQWLAAACALVAALTLLAPGLRPTDAGATERLAPFVVSTLVSDGFARLDSDRAAAEDAFRRALASSPEDGRALLGLGLATVSTDGALAAASLCEAASRGGAVGSAAREALASHGLSCDAVR